MREEQLLRASEESDDEFELESNSIVTIYFHMIVLMKMFLHEFHTSVIRHILHKKEISDRREEHDATKRVN